MGLYQGLNKLLNGYSRKLTQSELSRGYIFISKDQKINDGKGMELIINGRSFGVKKLDNSGRYTVGKAYTSKIGSKEVAFNLSGRTIRLSF